MVAVVGWSWRNDSQNRPARASMGVGAGVSVTGLLLASRGAAARGMGWRRGRGLTWRWAVGTSVARSAQELAEQVELLARSLHAGIEADQRLEVVKRRPLARRPRSQVTRLQEVPATVLQSRAEDRRPLQLVPDELRPFREDDEEPDELVVGRDARVPAQDGLRQHRGPLDLPRERHPAADIPQRVDVLEVLHAHLAEERRTGALELGEPRAQRPAIDAPALLPLADPHGEPQPMPEIREDPEQLAVLVGPPQHIVARHHAVRRGREAAIAVEARAHEGFVG